MVANDSSSQIIEVSSTCLNYRSITFENSVPIVSNVYIEIIIIISHHDLEGRFHSNIV